MTFTGTARRRFSPLSAGSPVLDALWIVAIILEQPAYALIVPSSPIRFWLLILSLQVLPQNKIKLLSSEKKLPQLFDFIWLPGNGMPGLNDIKKATLSNQPSRARRDCAGSSRIVAASSPSVFEPAVRSTSPARLFTTGKPATLPSNLTNSRHSE